jgi:hypothetical protein
MGYKSCDCGGCFEITIDSDFCDECVEAGCDERPDPSDTECCVSRCECDGNLDRGECYCDEDSPNRECTICGEVKRVCCDDGPGGDWCYCVDCCTNDHGPQPEGRVYYPEG